MGTCHQPHLYVVIITEHQSWTPRDTGDAHTGRCNVNRNPCGGCLSRNEEKLGQEIGMLLSLIQFRNLCASIRHCATDIYEMYLRVSLLKVVLVRQIAFLRWRLHPMSFFGRFACEHLFHSANNYVL